uniref:Uncharacterized protein n=1 Tax=Mycena chlorophos TaxID=658473 RepID=A0ABQ0LAV1_MYCCL|nr:predicted protein [Mycena chlorophos]
MLTFSNPENFDAQNYYGTQSYIEDVFDEENWDADEEEYLAGAYTVQDQDYYSDEEGTVYLTTPQTLDPDGYEWSVYEADRRTPGTRTARQQATEIYNRPQTRSVARSAASKPPTFPPTPNTSSTQPQGNPIPPRPPTPPKPVLRSPPPLPLPDPTPVDARRVRVVSPQEDVEMRDARSKPAQSNSRSSWSTPSPSRFRC